jgi:hypothetical protein
MQRCANDGAADTVTKLTHGGHMTEEERNRIWCAEQRKRRQAQNVVPAWANESDWKGLLYGLAIAIGGMAAIVGLLRWVL